MSSIARYLPWVSGLVLIAGVVAFAVVKLSDNGRSSKSTTVAATPSQQTKPKPAAKAVVPRNPKQQKAAAAKFDANARAVAGKFIITAVARKHLAQAWPIAGPAIRQDSTYKEWLSGNIAVIPFLDPIAGAKFSIQSLKPNEASIGVALIPKSPKKKVQFFDMTLIKVGHGAKRHWVVNYWIPRGGFAVPQSGVAGG